jgi:agmatine/peptidylarginine deiminase
MFYRLPAEWEKQDAIQFTFPHADSDWKLILEDAVQVFVDVIKAILPFEKVIVVTNDIAKTKSYFKDYSSQNLFFFDISHDLQAFLNSHKNSRAYIDYLHNIFFFCLHKHSLLKNELR